MKILFVHQGLVSFIEKDLRILEQAHTVRECYFPGHRKGWPGVIKDVLRLFRGVLWCDATFSWSGKLHAFFAVLFSRILGKKSLVVSGGEEVARGQEKLWSMFDFWWKRWCPLFVFKYADLILCVSEFNRGETIKNARADSRKIRLIYHGFDVNEFGRMPDIKKEDIVLTVSVINSVNTSRKGLRLFVESARFLPDQKFMLVGPWLDATIEDLKSIAPQNVSFTGWLSGDELVRACNRAKVYVQASVYEGFGCSVAEAMLCECVPVVSRREALPEVVGDCGLYLDTREPQELAQNIEHALDSDLGLKARERIMKLFPLEKRRSELLAAVVELAKGKH
ncbi:glycosyltransferase family 4 protein [Chloroflexota bacterium]